MSIWLYILGLILFVIVTVFGAFWLLGPERIWSLLGPADLGAVQFETLERSERPNDALACPTGLCAIDSDILPPVYPVDVQSLRKALLAALKTERLLTRVNIDDAVPSDRFVQRSKLMRFPDTIVVRYIAMAKGGSTLAIYSRSQLGHSDLGINQERIERWIQKLSLEIAKIRAGR